MCAVSVSRLTETFDLRGENLFTGFSSNHISLNLPEVKPRTYYPIFSVRLDNQVQSSTVIVVRNVEMLTHNTFFVELSALRAFRSFN